MKGQDELSESLKKISSEKWGNLGKKKIFFGHQSVGYNIIDGIKEVMIENSQIKLQIHDITEGNITPKGEGIWHARVGKNKDYKSKINSFCRYVEETFDETIDIAFIKFCYVDIFNEDSNIQEMFDNYKTAMLQMKKKYPKTNFIHVTIPLRTAKPTFISSIKGFLGEKNFEYRLNMKRNRFNDLLREEYTGKEPIFDLATGESTKFDGKRTYFDADGIRYFILNPEYSYDGGHLNRKGQVVVAKNLLIFLSSIEKN